MDRLGRVSSRASRIISPSPPGHAFRGRAARRTRQVAIAGLIVTCAAILTPIPSPPAVAQEATTADTPDLIYEQPLAVSIPELTREQLDPEPAPYPYSGVADPEIVKVGFGPGDTPEERLADETPIPEEGSMNADVYSPDEGVGDHLIAVSAGIFNVEQIDGDWVDASLIPTADAEGWTGKGPDYSVRFPSTLSSDSPLVLTLTKGQLMQSPSGADKSEGILEGRTIRYPDVFHSVDLLYELVPGGFKETVVLKDAAAKPGFSWDIRTEGLSLASTEDGLVQILGDAGPVMEFPPATATDSAATPASATSPYSLLDLGEGEWTVSVEIDPEYLASATYPVLLDPGAQTLNGPTDTYIDVNSSASNGSQARLKTGPSSTYKTYIKFPTTSWQFPDRLIYDAFLVIENDVQPDTGDPVTATRVVGTWGSSAAWPGPGSATPPDVVTATGPTDGTWSFQLDDLYQRFNDGEYPDRGVELTSSTTKEFYSGDSATPPQLLISYNDLPNAPTIEGPTVNTIDTQTPTLKIERIPLDNNDDEVLVRYQVTDVQNDWSGADDSGWIDETSFTIPSDWLTAGVQYWWRVQSADICNQPEGLCSKTDGTGAIRSWNDSGVQTFAIATKNWGEDERYAMWSEGLGNGMVLNVNQANGNLFLEAPIDQLSTPIGKLRIGLSYNSQAAATGNDKGLGPGWKLYAGPTSTGKDTPIELEELTPTPYSGVKVFFRGGGHQTLAWRGGNSYSNVGSPLVVRKNGNGTWTMRSDDGDVFTFNDQEQLERARPVYSKPKAGLAGNAGFFYEYNQDGQLTKVTDPIGRVVDFTWTTVGSLKRLTKIETWAGPNYDWDVSYLAGHVRTITSPEGEVSKFSYGTGPTAEFVTHVQNGEQSVGTPGWVIDYTLDTAPATEYEIRRVLQVVPPQSGAVYRWQFSYGAVPSDYFGYTSLKTKIVDPRGFDPASGFTNDYETTVTFNSQGLPVEIRAPKRIPSGAGAEPDWVTRMFWNSNGQIRCTRSPQAVTAGTSCFDKDTIADPLNTVYNYETREPYRLQSVTSPAPVTGANRQVTTYAYDDGNTFDGLWVEKFENPNLSGVPAGEALWTDLTNTWSGAPADIGNVDQWSLRLSGLLDLSGNSVAKRYEFKVDADDGVTFAVGSEVLLNCFGLERGVDYTGINCGEGTPSKKLWPRELPITIEFQEKTGTATLDVQWRQQGDTNWVDIPAGKLKPNLGLTTEKIEGHDGTGTNLALKTTWSYAGDLSKMLRLPDWKETNDLTSGYGGLEDVRRTEFAYDDYGRKTTITRWAGTAFEGDTIRTYTENAGANTSCLTKEESPTHIITRSVCNAAGDVTQTRLILRDETDPATGDPLLTNAPDRVTDYTFDRMGRLLTETRPDGGTTTNVYDDSGRTLSTAVLLDDNGAAADTMATTGYQYNDYATPSPQMIETRPDLVQVTHTYDWVGNEIATTDPRNAELSKTWVWKTVFDAQNRPIESWTPDPDGTGTKSELKTKTSYSVSPFQTTVTDPAGVPSVTVMDNLGRATATQTAGIAPTLTTYDKMGNVERVEQTSGGTVHSWSEHTYNAYGQTLTDVAPWKDTVNAPTGTPVIRRATTSYEYFASGWLKKLDGPLGCNYSTTNPNEACTAVAAEKDLKTYTYNNEGWLKSATYWTSDTQSWLTEIAYDDAGERLQIRTQRTAGAYQVRRWSYTQVGQVATYVEPHGSSATTCSSTGGTCTTTNTYDEGGRLRSVADPRGCTLTLSYDVLSQLTDRVASGAGCTGNEHFEYFDDGSQKQAKQNASGATSTFNMEYDFMGRPTKVLNGTATVSDYAYTTVGGQETGQLASVTTAGKATSYGWCTTDTGGCYKGLLDTVDESILTGKTDYRYDAAGRVDQRTDTQLGNPPWILTWTRGYEPETGMIDSQTIKKDTTTLGDFNLDYDESGSVIKRKENVGTDPRNDTWDYVYDAAGRMTAATGKDPADTTAPVSRLTWNYAYDGAGNRTSASSADATKTILYTLDDQGWPVADDNGTPGTGTDNTTYGYDQVGNLTSIDRAGTATTNDWRYTFDAWGRTTQAKKGPAGSPTLTVAYSIDALGRMGQRSAGGTSTAYTYEGTSEDAITSVTGGSTTTYSHTPGGALAQRVGTSGPRQVLLRDLHGDVVGAVTTGASATGSQTWYSAWGERTGSTSELGFQGQWTDASTSQVDMFSRMYEPTLGRFSSRDVLFGDQSDPMSLNQFAYTPGSPVTLTDILGLCADRGADGCPDQVVDQWHKVKDHYAEVRADQVEATSDYYHSDEYLFWTAVDLPEIAPLLFPNEESFMLTILRLNTPGEGMATEFPAGTTYEQWGEFDRGVARRREAHMSWAAAHGLLPTGWQVIGAGGLAICAFASAGACFWATVGITSTKVAYSAHDRLMKPSHEYVAFIGDTGFNVGSALLGRVGGIGKPFSAACTGSAWCSDNHLSNPFGVGPRYQYPQYPQRRGNFGI